MVKKKQPLSSEALRVAFGDANTLRNIALLAQAKPGLAKQILTPVKRKAK